MSKDVVKSLGQAVGLRVVSRRKSVDGGIGGQNVLEQLSQEWSVTVANQDKMCFMNE